MHSYLLINCKLNIMKKNFIIIALILSIFVSCKDSGNLNSDKISASDTITKLDIEPQREDGELKPMVIERNIDEDRNNAKKEITDMLASGQDIPSYLTLNYYLVDFISEGGQPRDIIDLGEWYKFEDNNMYEHGFFGKLKIKGKFIFDQSLSTILLYPESESSAPEEWKVLNSKDVIVLSGTPKFGNNSTQKHLQNVKEKPVLK